MEKHFMIDIEATGIDRAKEDLLSIGILEVTFAGVCWVPGRSREWLAWTDRQPESQFAKEHMSALYRRCNECGEKSLAAIREGVLGFLRECGVTGASDTYFMGWNASNFDLPFLSAKGILEPSRYETRDGKDVMVGDYHYRVYEMGGALSLAQNLTGWKRDELTDLAFQRGETPMPVGKEHDALFDCYRQLRILNGLIAILGDV